jgi:hypothetical protein
MSCFSVTSRRRFLCSVQYFFSSRFPIVRNREYAQFWQNPIPCYKVDKRISFSTIVGCNPNERHVHNFQRQSTNRCHWLVKDWLDIQSKVHSASFGKWHTRHATRSMADRIVNFQESNKISDRDKKNQNKRKQAIKSVSPFALHELTNTESVVTWTRNLSSRKGVTSAQFKSPK